MDLKQKVTRALTDEFQADRIELDAEGGISGIVVAKRFRGHESMDRQRMIYAALRKHRFTDDEIRQVLMISALTPEEASSYSIPQ
ncbi:MAG: hypothetical protein KDA52_24505 [Planctomycetaceae bacterium]|nr:hypothetical protein [Planctomycetaceae bacterium]